MNRFSKICLLVSVVSGVVGLLAGQENPILGGAGRALAGVFFIMFYIAHILQNEKMDTEVRGKSH